MSWLVKTLSSSIGKKFVMGVTGLLLCGFLVAHLAGNLLMYVGADAYNEYAHALHSQKILLPIAEVSLLALFAAHIVLAFRTSRENRAARSTSYAVKASKIDGGSPNSLARADTWMLVSGGVVLLFLILHLVDMRLELRPDIDYSNASPFERTVRVLRTPLTCLGYLAGSLFLGLHVSHGFASAFQSLGVNHPKWTPWIQIIALIFAIVIALGFASFPVLIPLGNPVLTPMQ